MAKQAPPHQPSKARAHIGMAHSWHNPFRHGHVNGTYRAARHAAPMAQARPERAC